MHSAELCGGARQNIKAWSKAMIITYNFGMRYRIRLQSYMGVYSILVLVMAGGTMLNFVENYNAPQVLQADLFFQMMIFEIAIVFVPNIALIILQAGCANEAADSLELGLVQLRVKLRDANPVCASAYSDCFACSPMKFCDEEALLTDAQLDTAVHLVRALAKAQPFRVLGTKGRFADAAQLFTITSSLLAFIMQHVFSSSVNDDSE
ncbi:hypothetical protein CYMTET_33691 [Cymbomonas tetramitiformis]|uniref:Uncharacterized protein n=1 Tax=Cymbomonas tetramitiformis TaxID=36881 RepID=A0AAE0FCM4_9CHLO|nr:hypothetical protein CYMTET_33691 [Cymbomonas tetramitiformis]